MAAPGRKQPRRVRIFLFRQRCRIIQLPTALGHVESGHDHRLRRIVDRHDGGSCIVNSVSDQHLVAGLIVADQRPIRRDCILLVSEEVLQFQPHVVPLRLDGHDASSFQFADDSWQLGRQQLGSPVQAGQPEITLQTPRAR
jgi:hypothetical protein